MWHIFSNSVPLCIIHQLTGGQSSVTDRYAIIEDLNEHWAKKGKILQNNNLPLRPKSTSIFVTVTGIDEVTNIKTTFFYFFPNVNPLCNESGVRLSKLSKQSSYIIISFPSENDRSLFHSRLSRHIHKFSYSFISYFEKKHLIMFDTIVFVSIQ